MELSYHSFEASLKIPLITYFFWIPTRYSGNATEVSKWNLRGYTPNKGMYKTLAPLKTLADSLYLDVTLHIYFQDGSHVREWCSVSLRFNFLNFGF